MFYVKICETHKDGWRTYYPCEKSSEKQIEPETLYIIFSSVNTLETTEQTAVVDISVKTFKTGFLSVAYNTYWLLPTPCYLAES